MGSRPLRLLPFACGALLLALAAPARGQDTVSPDLSQVLPIRVLIGSGSSVSLVFPPEHSASAGPKVLLDQASTPLTWKLGAHGGHVTVTVQGGQTLDLGTDRLNLQNAPGLAFLYGGKAYRGNATVIAHDTNLNVVNALPVEDYVRGVLPAEMPSGWPMEALKAQAVIARTYAISRLTQTGEYDVCATTACQVYGGMGAEAERGDEAAEATRGLIAAYAGKPARTFFHSDSGGFTASSREVWGEAIPYLPAQPDPDSRAARAGWSVKPTMDTISAVMNRCAPNAGAYRGLKVTEKTESGRVYGLAFTGTRGTATVDGARAQDCFRSLGAQSTLGDITSSSPLQIDGSGWGHGVGLSQYGAKNMAARGWTFDQILGFYYPGVTLANYNVVH
ncbi:MAG TPA: SpoIID/LytB domain-containing protein [Deinococcales bacterium]|nr:SpoIID/LytB domain-containing protein [Deinococcales bacterium]